MQQERYREARSPISECHSIEQAPAILQPWRQDYNEPRPHSMPGDTTAAEVAAELSHPSGPSHANRGTEEGPGQGDDRRKIGPGTSA